MPATNKFEVSENGNLTVSGKNLIDFMSHLIFILSRECHRSSYLHRFLHIREP